MRRLFYVLMAVAGQTHSTDFSQMESFGGTLINPGENPLYSYEHLSDGKTDFIVLKREIGRAGPSPIWKSVDVLAVPEVEDRYLLYLGLCSWIGEIDSRIVAIAGYDLHEESNDDVKKAWVADLKSEKFERVGTDDITCYNEAYGL